MDPAPGKSDLPPDSWHGKLDTPAAGGLKNWIVKLESEICSNFRQIGMAGCSANGPCRRGRPSGQAACQRASQPTEPAGPPSALGKQRPRRDSLYTLGKATEQICARRHNSKPCQGLAATIARRYLDRRCGDICSSNPTSLHVKVSAHARCPRRSVMARSQFQFLSFLLSYTAIADVFSAPSSIAQATDETSTKGG